MANQHTVKQGEHLSRVAANRGLSDYRVIWKHAGNTDLVNQRKSPNILLPGDLVKIPDKQVKRETAATTKTHKYKLSAPILTLRIALKDFDNQAMPGIDCEMEVEGKTTKVKSDAQGLIEREIPRTAENGKLRIPDDLSSRNHTVDRGSQPGALQTPHLEHRTPDRPGFMALFSTHPPIEARIAALEGRG